MGGKHLIALAILGATLSLAACNCGAHHEKPDDPSGDDGGVNPRAGAGSRGGEDAAAGASGEGGGSGDRADAGIPQDASDGPSDEGPKLIPTSGSHAVLAVGEQGEMKAGELIVLDLERGELQRLGTSDPMSFTLASPDGAAILFGGDDHGSMASNFFIARLRGDGAVSRAPIDCFENDDGHRELLGWTEDSRYALLARFSEASEHAVELVDAQTARCVWAVEGVDTSQKTGKVAPGGRWLSYGITGGAFASSGLLHVTASGVDEFEIADMTYHLFSPSGTRLVYASGLLQGAYRDLSEPDVAKPLVIADRPEIRLFPFAFSGDDHIIAAVLTDPNARTLGRLELATGELTGIALPGTSYPLMVTADASSLIAIEADEAGAQTALWLIDVLGEHEPAEIATLDPPAENLFAETRLGALGPRHFFYAQPYHEMTLVARDDDGTVAAITVTEAGEDPLSCLPAAMSTSEASERFAFLAKGGTALIVVDLSRPLAARVARFEARAGGALACPVWNARRTALAFVEQVGALSTLHTMDWPEAGPIADPEIAYESEEPLRLVAFQP